MRKIAKPHKWTDEQEKYIKKIVKGRSRKETHRMVNKKFGLSLTFNQIVGYMKRNGLTTGFDGRFKKGQPSWNKGMKGLNTGGEKGWFVKGQKSINYKKIGSEMVDVDGYVRIKVQDHGTYPERWRAKHRILWEKKYGKIPEGYAVIFGDGDKANLDIDNLVLVSRAQLAVLNNRGLIK